MEKIKAYLTKDSAKLVELWTNKPKLFGKLSTYWKGEKPEDVGTPLLEPLLDNMVKVNECVEIEISIKHKSSHRMFEREDLILNAIFGK